jgi:hypothetical protein
MKNPCPKCGAAPEKINEICTDPEPATAWLCGTWLNSPTAPAPGLQQTNKCKMRDILRRFVKLGNDAEEDEAHMEDHLDALESLRQESITVLGEFDAWN